MNTNGDWEAAKYLLGLRVKQLSELGANYQGSGLDLNLTLMLVVGWFAASLFVSS